MDNPLHGTPVKFDNAFRSTAKVQGYTHDFYKYPARFSPDFARAVLDSFTDPGDYVLDPFMGGGTTIVEAAASGRQAIGSDLNKLAHFVTRVKTTPLSNQDITEVCRWVRDVQDEVGRTQYTCEPVGVPVRNMPPETYPFFAIATKLITSLRFPRRRQFAKCALVRLGQWALDARLTIPGTDALCSELEKRVERMIIGLSDLAAAAKVRGTYKNKITAARQLMAYSASDPSLVRRLRRLDIRPKLILTSPPYPGVHMLYHRWQVLGRKETPAPYWIAGIQDGHGESYYTMGGRSALGIRNYFRGISDAFRNLRTIASPDTTLVQLISFSDTAVQLPVYLDALNIAGFQEASIGGVDSQQVRAVPNRKWYNQRRPRNDASREVLLVHRPSG